MARNLEIDLQRIGLDEREAKAYLAALELGPSPVQKIAQRAGVPRATTYLVLDDLRNKGFVTTYDEGKKTLFVAESPERLAVLVDEREADVKRQRETIKKLVPELVARGQFEKGERPVVRYYEGSVAVFSVLKDFVGRKGDRELVNFLHLDKARETLEKAGYPIEFVRQRRERYRIKSRVIYTAREGPVRGYASKLRQAKYIDPREFNLRADIAVRDDRVLLAHYGSRLSAIAIDDHDIASAIKLLFEQLWRRL